ncbi:hypothetical protein BT93_B2354 [Corymbia citriodora subsp. variegata]|nr:hypothetical protein BT93_B2354 [Corymbia citriodora subsp. variegata]
MFAVIPDLPKEGAECLSLAIFSCSSNVRGATLRILPGNFMPSCSRAAFTDMALCPTLSLMHMANVASLEMLSRCSRKCPTETKSPGLRSSLHTTKLTSLTELSPSLAPCLEMMGYGRIILCTLALLRLALAWAASGSADDARAVFDSILVKNAISWTAMVSAYARSGLKSDAMAIFESAPARTLFSWTALISGLVQSGNNVDAFQLFIDMRREGVDIVDPLVLSSIVGACANLATLELGKQIHGLVVLLGYESCLFISNAIIDMYAKCSDILGAKDIFNVMNHRDVVSWTSIIVGTAQHGKAEEALELFDKMVSTGVKPNEVTFVGLIYACSHVGLVHRGRSLFNSMIKDYGITPSLQHYTCLLDLLSRSGHLDEAENLINQMPFQPDEPTWAAFLSACKQHGKIEMAVRIADGLLSLKPEDPSTYILLSNIYAHAAIWDKVAKIRKLMTLMEVRKEPGYSCIDIGKEKQVFYAGETTHPMKDEIFCLLNELDTEMRRRGYVPDTSSVLHDMEQQEKERQLFWHSERLAVAYGLLKSVPGTVIRIVKNLRVCGDCHTVLKFISVIVKREIIVRDANRYHHFKGGTCSCNDFW